MCVSFIRFLSKSGKIQSIELSYFFNVTHSKWQRSCTTPYCDSNSSPFSTMSYPSLYVFLKWFLLCEVTQFKIAQNKLNLFLWKENSFFFFSKSSAGGLLWTSEQAVDHSFLLGILSALSVCFYLFLFNVITQKSREAPLP